MWCHQSKEDTFIKVPPSGGYKSLKRNYWAITKTGTFCHPYEDANQTPLKSITASGPKKYRIEWLQLERGLDDPSIQHYATCISPYYQLTPQPTQITGGFVSTYAQKAFRLRYSELSTVTPHKLTINNVQAKQAYKKYTCQQLQLHWIWERAKILYDQAVSGMFNDKDWNELDLLDSQITKIFIHGEHQCAKQHESRDPWSPALLISGETLSNWKRKIRVPKPK